MMSEKTKTLIICILIPLVVGGISGWITNDAMSNFESTNQPPLSPPGWLFPVVWSVLYILMGIASYLVFQSKGEEYYRRTSLIIYAIQLFFNFMWSVLFFNLKLYLISFVWLVILWILIIAMMNFFAKCDKRATFLIVPYLIWVSFAAYLNFGVYFLN